MTIPSFSRVSRILTLALILLATSLASQAYRYGLFTTYCVDGVYYQGTYYYDDSLDEEFDAVEVTRVKSNLDKQDYKIYSGDVNLPSHISVQVTREDKTITLQVPVIGIQARAFQNNSELTSVSLPPTLRYIEKAAFKGCTGLTSITIPASVRRMQDCVFDGCTNISTMYFNARECHSDDFDYKSSEEMLFPPNLTKIVLGATVEFLPPYLYYMQNSFQEITIPSHVKRIGKAAMSFCTNLQKVTLHSGITEIGEKAFYASEILHEIILPADTQISEIFGGTFANTPKLTLMTIPQSVKSVGPSAFFNCGLREIRLSDVEAVGDGAFGGCPNLERLELGKNVKSIGRFAMLGSDKLMHVILPTPTPPAVNYYDITDYVAYPGIGNTLYVPSESLSTYQNSDYAKFFMYIKPLSGADAGIDCIESDATVSRTIYDLQGRIVRELRHGNIYIMQGKKFIQM